MQKTRYFLLDNENLVYFLKDTDKVAKGYKSLKGATARHQDKSSAALERSKWHEMDKSHRIIIKWKGKESKPSFIYSDDLEDSKAFVVRIKTMADQQYTERLQNTASDVSFFYRINLFRSFWIGASRVYDRKTKN